MKCEKCGCNQAGYVQKRRKFKNKDEKWKRTDFTIHCPKCDKGKGVQDV